MKVFRSFSFNRYLFAVVVGLTDGILTALTFASGRLSSGNGGIRIGLVCRLALAASFSGLFIFFTAEYVRLRGELVEASKQLNLASHGHLATTQLGKAVRHDAVSAAILSAACNFFGTGFPLVIGVIFPTTRWLALAISILALGILGIALGYNVCGSASRWSVSLMLSGLVSALIGIEVHIV